MSGTVVPATGAAVERVLHRLLGVKKIAAGWIARCPVHDDQHQSLQITPHSDQSVGLHCHAGCEKLAILSAMGLTFSDLFAPTGNQKQLVATYDYRTLDGTLLYQACRYFPKEFRQRRPDGDKWIWDMTIFKGKHVPYRWPELQGHPKVAVVEGEKDVDRLWKEHIPATTNIGGAKKWTASETRSLVSAGVSHVLIIPDNDETGHQHAELVARSAKSHGLMYSIVELPDIEPHGDVSDWLNNGGCREDLLTLFESTPYVVTAAHTATTQVIDPTEVTDALDLAQYHLTDLGMAETLRDRFGDRLRYDHQREQWLLWDGHYWKPDVDEAAYRLAHEHIRLLQRDAVMMASYTERKEAIDHTFAREKRGPMVAMMAQAASLKPFALAGDIWDTDGMVLGCPNGLVDLKTGVFRDGTRDDLITLQAGASYVPTATCPRWLTFLDEVFQGKLDLIDFVHRAIGYSLTADMREQCFFVAFGSGSNGKSILLDTLEVIFGSYGHRADMRMFAGSGQESSSFQNADFRGKRLIFAAEVRPGSRMNEHVLKNFTGGETLRAEHKYGRSFTIRPVGKIWLGVNHRPKVSDESYGFWRRVRMIPFTRTFTGISDDRSLRSRLRAEAEGILAWAVQGCLAWQEKGLGAPAVVLQATDDYQQGEDPLTDFFTTRLSTEDHTANTDVSRLYSVYRDWANSQGISDREKLTAKSFTNSLSARGFERIRHGITFCFKGLEVIEPNMFDQPAPDDEMY